MTLDRLRLLAPPPPEPVRAPDEAAFASCEADLGLTLPSDYKDLFSGYGRGRFVDYLFTYPLDDAPMTLRRNKDLLAGHEGSRRRYPDWYPYPLYPEAGGLLIWGGTYDGHTLCWLTEGEPGHWPIVVWHQRDSQYGLYAGGTVAFVRDWLDGKLDTTLLPQPGPGDKWFEPARKLKEVYVYLDGGSGSFPERAAQLKRLLGSAADRGSDLDDDDSHYEEHFATRLNWRVSYSQWPAGRLIRIAFPAEHEAAARTEALAAATQLGHTFRHAQLVSGERVWAD